MASRRSIRSPVPTQPVEFRPRAPTLHSVKSAVRRVLMENHPDRTGLRERIALLLDALKDQDPELAVLVHKVIEGPR